MPPARIFGNCPRWYAPDLEEALRRLRERDDDVDSVRLVLLAIRQPRDVSSATAWCTAWRNASSTYTVRFPPLTSSYKFVLASVRFGTLCGNSTIGSPAFWRRCATATIW